MKFIEHWSTMAFFAKKKKFGINFEKKN